MVAVIEGLLSKDQVQTIAKRLFGAQFVDGSMSGGPLGESIKKNTQVSPQSPEYRELAQLVLGVLRQNDKVAITATFEGSDILIFGAVKRETTIPEIPLDVVITVSGPSLPVTVIPRRAMIRAIAEMPAPPMPTQWICTLRNTFMRRISPRNQFV